MARSGSRDLDPLMRFIKPYDAARMAAHRVGLRVNQPENDDASLIDEVPAGPAQHELL